MGEPEKLDYHILDISSYGRLTSIFDQPGMFLPHPQLSVAAVAENDKREIVGVAILQTVLHMEPWWTRPDWAGKVSIPLLQDLLEDRAKKSILFPGYLVTLTDPKHETLARIRGLQKIPATAVYRRGIRSDATLEATLSGLFGGGGQTGQQKALTTQETASSAFGLAQAEATIPAATSGLTSSLNFFQTLLSGNRTAIAQAISPDVQNIQTQAAAAQKSTDEFAPRGGGATAANEESRFGTAKQISDLFTGARSAGASGVTSISSLLGNLGSSLLSGSESTASNTVGQLAQSQQNQQQQQAAAGQAIGSLVALLAA